MVYGDEVRGREVHAISRARERYGVELTIEDLQAGEVDIASGKSMKMGDGEGGTSIHVLRIGGIAMRAVVTGAGLIGTILPLGARLGGRYPHRKNGKHRRRRGKSEKGRGRCR